MKKFTGLLLAYFGILLFPLSVFAVDYSINETKIDAYLQENGAVEVTELHTYEFDGEFNGITRTLFPKDGTSISDFTASENGTPLSFDLDEATYRIYRGGEDETITIELSYVIQNGVDVYEDMAQFYWTFFDSNNESDFENLTIQIHPPQTTDDVIAYGFHETYGKEKIESNGTVIFDIGFLESGKSGDIRVAYDSAIFPLASVNHSGTIRDELIREQQELAERAATFLAEQEFLGNLAPIVIAVYGVFFLSLLFYAWRRKQTTQLEVERQFQPRSIVPKEIMSMPATIFYFRNFQSGFGELLTIGMMDLVRKGNIEVKEDETYYLVNRKTDSKYQALLIQLLFRKVGENNTFTFAQLETYLKSTANQKTFHLELSKYHGLLMQEINSYHLFDKHKKLRWFTGIVSLLLIPFMIIFGLYHLFMWLFISLVLMIALLTFSLVFHSRTVKGQIIKQEWEHFKTNFIEMESKSWYMLSEDDKERALLFTTGINDKKLAEKNEYLYKSSMNSQDDSSYQFILLFTLFTTANINFGSATQTYAHSSSGTVPSAGTGVGGGGGGSGAF